MGVASLVLGIISIVIGVFSAGSLGWPGAIIGIIGIVFAIQGKKITDQTGMAQAGFICSIIRTILCLLTYIVCVACVCGWRCLRNRMKEYTVEKEWQTLLFLFRMN